MRKYDIYIITEVGHFEETMNICHKGEIVTVVDKNMLDDYFSTKVRFKDGREAWITKGTKLERLNNFGGVL